MLFRSAVQIVHGKGLGQTRRISSTLGDVITLSENWNVAPDTTSLIMLSDLTRRLVGYNNSFDGDPLNTVLNYGTPSRSIASAGFQAYDCGASEWIIDNNTFYQIKSPVRLYGRFFPTISGSSSYYTAGVYFNDVRNNTFNNCMNGVTYVADSQTSSGTFVEATNFVGNLVFNNTFTNLTGQVVDYEISGHLTEKARILKGVFDQNTIYGASSNLTGYSSDEWTQVNNTLNGSACSP